MEGCVLYVCSWNVLRKDEDKIKELSNYGSKRPFYSGKVSKKNGILNDGELVSSLKYSHCY